MTIPDIIESVVDAMKVFSFTSIIRLGGSATYHVFVSDRDVQYWYVGARCYCISDGVTYYCTVTGLPTAPSRIAIRENNGTVFDETLVTEFGMDINYKHGHPLDVFNQLNEMARSKDYAKRRFPVIALFQDFTEEPTNGISTTPITVIIARETDPAYTAAQRYTNVFEGKKLLKLYERFVAYLQLSTYTYFRMKDHTKTDRLFWGRDGAFGNEANVTGDHVDAIELSINLKTLKIC